jgi:hypothetical protein
MSYLKYDLKPKYTHHNWKCLSESVAGTGAPTGAAND